MKVAGARVVITGAGGGIGRATALRCARAGAADLVCVDIDAQTAEETAAACGGAAAYTCDVADAAAVQELADAVEADLGRLDVLVNNAAYQQHAASIEEITDERLDLTFRTNIHGYFHMARAALPHMKERGSIINTGSVTGLKGSPKLLDYSSTKGAIHAFTKALAQNVIDKGIRVNAVAPGPVWTPLNPADSPADKVAEFGSDTQMKRAAQPEELSPAFVFLASPVCSGYITGIVLPVTGSVGAI